MSVELRLSRPGGKRVADLAGCSLTLIVWLYWSHVLFRSAAYRLRYQKASGLLPRKLAERLLWPIWVPVIIGWNLVPWLTLTSHKPGLMLPDWARVQAGWFGLRCLAAGLGGCCYLLTVHCWRRMGRSWSIAVDPHTKTELIRTGPYSRIRHPIYTLSILLMICSLVVIPTVPMFVLAVLHVVFLVLKARGEEGALLASHGQVYADYCGQTRRFVPWKATKCDLSS